MAGDAATRFAGTSAGTAASRVMAYAPQVFTAEAWVRTTSTAGGKVIGFGDSATGASTSFDRSIYVDATGHARFGTYNGTRHVITSPGVVHRRALASPGREPVRVRDGVLCRRGPGWDGPGDLGQELPRGLAGWRGLVEELAGRGELVPGR